MKKMITGNVIPMDAWKQALHLRREEKSLLDYLNVLSFHDLMNESKDVVKELETAPLTDDITLKTKLLTEEISARLSHYSEEISLMLSSMIKNLEEKLK